VISRAKGFSAKLFLTTDKSRPRCACAEYEAARALNFSPGGMGAGGERRVAASQTDGELGARLTEGRCQDVPR